MFAIHVGDNDNIITGVATKPDGTNYDPSEITTLEILVERPDETTLTPYIATVNSDGTFEFTATGTPFDQVGFWGFQAKYTFPSGQIVFSDVQYQYIARVIT